MDGTPAHPGVLGRMMHAQRHRGPDDHGARLFSLRNATSVEGEPLSERAPEPEYEGALGHNRLSILDVSASGRQPMATADGNIIIAYNGEVYNAFDYRSELQKAGYVFRSRSDTEVLLYLYDRYGIEGMLERLNGMFALCIIDLRERALYLVRDRLGIKPLYTCKSNNTLLFASEIKSFLSHPDFSASLDEEGLDEYVMFRGRVGSGTMFSGVRALLPGHYLRITPERIEQRAYWTLSAPAQPLRRSLKEGEAELAERLERSVRRQLLSDVPLGCQLSGGIDSSLVNVYAAESVGVQIDAFSVTLDSPDLTEERWMDRVAKAGDIVIHKQTLTGEHFASRFPLATWHMDEPLHIPNAVGIFFLAENATQHVKVLLSGEGADELLGGYHRFYHAQMRKRVQPLLPLLLRLPWPARFRDVRSRWAANDAVETMILGAAYYHPSQAQALRPELRYGELIAARRAIFNEEESRGRDQLAACVGYELRTYLPQLLVRQDKMTMAHSVENRVPFLDDDLVEYARAMPSGHLVRPNWAPHRTARSTKLALKRIAAERFGQDFAYRNKSGFSLPLGAFCRGALRPSIEGELLPGIRRRGIFDPHAVDALWQQVLSGDASADEAFWTCIAFEQWAQLFLDGRGSLPPIA